MQSLSLLSRVRDGRMRGLPEMSFHSGAQPFRSGRAHRTLVKRCSRFLGKPFEKQWERDDPVDSRRANIARRIEYAFHRAGVVIEPAADPVNRPARNQFDIGSGFMKQ